MSETRQAIEAMPVERYTTYRNLQPKRLTEGFHLLREPVMVDDFLQPHLRQSLVSQLASYISRYQMDFMLVREMRMMSAN
jgi:hypothetical protein